VQVANLAFNGAPVSSFLRRCLSSAFLSLACYGVEAKLACFNLPKFKRLGKYLLQRGKDKKIY